MSSKTISATRIFPKVTENNATEMFITEAEFRKFCDLRIIDSISIREAGNTDEEDGIWFELVISLNNDTTVARLINYRRSPRKWRDINKLREFLQKFCPRLKKVTLDL